MVSMDNLPDQLMLEIFSRIKNTSDRNSISLACKRFYSLDNEQRTRLHLHCALNHANEPLTTLCHRFPNLNEVEIEYSSWTSSESRKQLDYPSLSILPNICPFLTDLTLTHGTFITDAGLSSLASCSKLSSLKLNYIPRITGSGLLPIVSGCKNLITIHLIRCSNIRNLGWIDCLGRQETLQDLCIKNCRGIEEGDLFKLGPTWRIIKRLQFEVDSNYRYTNPYRQRGKQWVPCENMLELNLSNCVFSPGRRGLACILDKCKNLEKVHLDRCKEARDCHIIGLAQNSKNLRAISITVALGSPLTRLMDDPFHYNLVRLTDDSLKSLAQNCTRLESVSLSFAGGESQLTPFSLDGILRLVKLCPVKKLVLDGVYCFNDTGLEALCGCDHLQTLVLMRCQKISDEGLEFVARYPSLRALWLTNCLNVTDNGFKPLTDSCRLELLAVNYCPQVSLSGVQGAAKSVSYR